MENKDYGEIFCQAVDEIVGQRLEAVKFDSTILCTIVDDSNRAMGKYVVTHNGGITKFEAFSENTEYRNNNNVYVQIPGGDWDQQKMIIGKKTDNDDEPYIYKKPFSSLVDITGNLITGSIERKATGLIANQDIIKTSDGKSSDKSQTEKAIDLWTYNIDNSTALCREEGAAQSSYTRLGIQADFQSWLNNFYASAEGADSVSRAVTQGEYGLRLILTVKRGDVVSVDTNTDDEDKWPRAQYILELNTNDMNGNPYNFASFYTQQKLFDISSLGEIEKMQLQFYEVTGSFVDNEDYYISDVDFLGNSITPNLYVNDVYISLGYDVDEFDTEMVQIYTLDSATYSRTASPLTDNHKKLQLRWIHKLDDGTYKSITTADNIGDYSVYWYRYQLGAASADQYSGVYWKYLSSQTSEGYKILDPDWELYNNNAELEFYRHPSYFTSWAIPDTTLQTEQFKAIIVYNGTPYRSNILTFQNKDEVVSAPTVDAVQALSINCEDGTYGNYRIYNQGNSLLDSAQSSVKRQWKAYFKSSLEEVSEDNPECELTEAEQIEWIIPLTKTMIVIDGADDGTYDEGNNPFYSYDYDTDGNKTHIHIFKYGDANNEYNIQNSNTLTYRIRGYYSQSYSNNTIQCKIVKDKITYTATKEMTFGIAGTTGTDCTFILDFDNGVTAVSPEDSSKGLSVSVTARLYDYENNEVDLTDYANNITWSWKDTATAKNIQIGKNQKGITVPLVYNGSSTLSYNYNILQATLTGWGDYDLKAYLPIPIRKKIDYNYISGTTQVIYNSNGEIADYFKNPYKLYETGIEKTGIVWDKKNYNESETTNGYTPDVSLSSNGEYYLTPLSFYVENACENVCVYAKLNNVIVWSQPLLIMTNRYPSAMLNSWDGSLDVGKTDEGTILAPRLAAGRKEKDNTFTGVVLGDWQTTDSDNSLTEYTGLFGYNSGEQTYGFRDNGTAFIGKSGVGRIEIDGTEGVGTIKSAGYTTDEGTGMLIDLGNNKLTAKRNGSTVFTLQDADPYFEITNKANTKLMHVGDSTYYLQSANYANKLSNTTKTSYVVIGTPYSSSTYTRWKNLYGTLYYYSNGSYIVSSGFKSGTKLYYKTIYIEASATRTGSHFDLNNGELTINRGYINGDVILQPDQDIEYTTYTAQPTTNWSDYYYAKASGSSTLPQSSLVNMLSEIYSNISYAQAQGTAASYNANTAKATAEAAADAATAAKDAADLAQEGVDYLKAHFGLGDSGNVGIWYDKSETATGKVYVMSNQVGLQVWSGGSVVSNLLLTKSGCGVNMPFRPYGGVENAPSCNLVTALQATINSLESRISALEAAQSSS